MLVFSILLSQNFSSFAYTNNIRYNYFVNSSGQQISEYKIIKALQNSENIEFYDNNSYEKDKFTLNALENQLNRKNVYQYEIRPKAIPAIYAVYTIVVLGVTYTLTIYNNGEILIKAGQKVIDAASAAGRAVMKAARNIINSALKKIDENKKNKEKEKKYNEDKKKGNPTNNHSTKKQKNEKDNSGLPTSNTPYSSKDLKDSKGNLKQRRYYGKNGQADEDIDYRHGNGDGSHTFPHRHKWINGRRY